MKVSIRSWMRVSCAAVLCLSLVSQDACAWGPRARRATAAAAMSQVRRDVGVMFAGGGRVYERDLIRGAEAGMDLFDTLGSTASEAEALDTIMNEIELLRTIRHRGAGSYLAYRMGVLSSLVAQVMMPYGFPRTPEERDLYARMMTDIERHVDTYHFDSHRSRVVFIDHPQEYFAAKRPFLEDDRAMILEAYELGRGYGSFMDKAGPSYFQRSVEAVADAWNTIINAPDSIQHKSAADWVVAKYYIAEIGFQLEVKKNIKSAGRAYRDFVEVSPGNMEHYIDIGDLYYAYATPESKERGVHEWKLARRAPGPHARVAARRISAHYLTKGELLFERAHTPEALDTDLEDARRAFQVALEHDGTSERAAGLISEATIAIAQRRELYDQQQQFIDSAILVRENAERSLLEGDFADALSSFQMALNTVEMVGPEFADLQEEAKDISGSLRKDVKNVISDIFDLANKKIAEGDTMASGSKYEEALNTYRTVKSILDNVPEEEGSIDTQRKLDLVDLVNEKIEDTSVRVKNKKKKGKGKKG